MAVAHVDKVMNYRSTGGLIIVLLCFYFSNLLSQDPTFRMVLGDANEGYGVLDAHSVIEKGNYYYTYSQHFELSVQNWGATMAKINKQGDIVKVNRIYDSTTIFFPPSDDAILEWHPGLKSFISRYGTRDSVHTNGLFLFDENMERWDTLRYHPPAGILADWFFDLAVLPNNDIIVTGEVILDGQEKVVAHLVKYNDKLEVTWARTYGDTGRIAYRPRQVLPAPDGGYLIAGYQRLWGAGVPMGLKTIDPLLIRTDSLGNLLWKKTYGGPLMDWKGAHVAYRDDSTIVMYYAEGVRQIQSDRFESLPVFSLVNDRTGKVIRKRRFTELREFRFHSMDLLKDGDKFIGVGKLDEMDQQSPERGSGQGYMFSVDSALNPLAYRQYTLKDSNAKAPERTYFYSLRKTSDGGYLAGGQADLLDTAGVPLAHLGYNGIVFKMDSMGCISGTACVDTFGITPVDTAGNDTTAGDTAIADSTGPQNLQIYPNPSSRYFTIEWAAAPSARVDLYNLQGQRVAQTHLEKGKGKLEPRPNLAAGLYFIRVTGQNGTGTKVQKVLWDGPE